MNPHLSPFTTCTNSVLQAMVDLLIQQAVLRQSSSAGSSVPSAVTSLTANNSNISPVPVIPASAVVPASSSQPLPTPVNPSSNAAPATPVNTGSAAFNPGNGSGDNSGINALPAPLSGSPYTFQTCPTTASPPIDPS